MTIFNLRCDRCGRGVAGPIADTPTAGGLTTGSLKPDGPAEPSEHLGVRFLYHPGDFFLKDDAGMLCGACWSDVRAWLGTDFAEGRCAACGEAVEHARSLHLHRANDPYGWQLCKAHAVEFLNGLRTVEPKLTPETLTLAGDWAR